MHMTGVSGATGRVLYERRQKESHRETVTYEIEMLHFCFDNLPQDRSCDRSNEYLLLEGFLLHYRNLLEFFSGTHHRAGYDISMADSSTWGNRELGAAEIAAIVHPATCRWIASTIRQFRHTCSIAPSCDMNRPWLGMRQR